jgi:hypothetical protein
MAGTQSRRLAQNRFVSPMKRAPYFCASFFAPIVHPFRDRDLYKLKNPADSKKDF